MARSGFPAARHLDRHPSRQHRDVLRRQDRRRPGHRHRVPADDVRRARHRLRHGPGSSWAAPTSRRTRAARAAPTRSRRDGVRDAQSFGRSTARAARARQPAPRARRWQRSTVAQRHDLGESGPVEEGHLRRARRRQALQRRAHGPQRRCHHRQGRGEAGAASCASSATPLQRYDIPGKVDGSLKWAVDMKVPGMLHARNVRPPCRRRDAAQHRRVVGRETAGFRPRREQRQLCGRGLRTRGTGDPRGAAAESRMEDAGHRAVPALERAVRLHATRNADGERRDRSRRATRMPRSRARAQRHRGRVRGAVPGTHGDRPRARAGRSVRRPA